MYKVKIVAITVVLFILSHIALAEEYDSAHNQNNVVMDSSDVKLIKVAKEIMTASNNCALITLDENGLPHARVMDPFDPENDLTVWFGSNSQSKKVFQIKRNPNVTLYYLDKDGSGYVTIHGVAQIVDSLKEKEKWWKDEWMTFYPNRPDGYILIKVIPKWMEVISYTRGIVGDPVTWQAPITVFDSK